MIMQHQNTLAQRLRAACQPRDPLILTNVYDASTAANVAANPSTKALATTSYAIAETEGYSDNELPLELNIARIKLISSVAAKSDLPLTVDLQDGYGDVKDAVGQAIAAGAVGCNLEDTADRGSRMRTTDEAVKRISEAMKAAEEAGIPDFVVNARTDVLGHGGSIEDAIERGKAYLAAGATTVFIWGGLQDRGVSRYEVIEIVKALCGMVNVRLKLAPGYLTPTELGSLGVARMSIGPDLYLRAMESVRNSLEKDTQ